MNRHKETRRSFIGKTALALTAPTVITSTALGNADTPAASERLTLAGIGMGGRGRGDINAFMGRKDIVLVAACDVAMSRAEGVAKGANGRYGEGTCKAYQDFREPCGRDDIDLVFCGTPDHWHALITIDACKNGKDVFCEKPLSLTIEEGRAMVEAARRYGRVFSSGSQRVMGDYGRLAEAVRSGVIGKVSECWTSPGGPPRRCYLGAEGECPKDLNWDLWLGPAPYVPYNKNRWSGAYGLGGKGFRTWRAYSGGMTTDWGGHKFGGALNALGKELEQPVKVVCKEDSDCGNPYVVFADGLKFVNGGGKPGPIWFKGEFGEVPGAKPTGPVDMPRYKGSGGINGDFVHCVKTRERPFRDVEKAHCTAVVCHLFNIAHEIGRSFDWDPATESSTDPEVNRLRGRTMRGEWSL